ncbi:MAG: segregation/condensation protein A [Rhodospirillales bacterium]|nr:segregation/condensation protein A [Rhodospirillales bacterium]MCW9040115.1 segregation/condensation protein A [Rhodospirillales bacterium]
MESEDQDFEGPENADDRPEDLLGVAFVVDIDGYEGPLDVLLALAREQKVDLVHVSILQLADQFLHWVTEARRASLDLAADYLVMAAWLAYLKSRMLIPEPEGAEEPSGEEMAAALAFQLQRLEGMQEAGGRLMARPRLGQDFHARGMTESFRGDHTTIYEVTLYDLLKAYGEHKRRADVKIMRIEPSELHTVDAAIKRLRTLLGNVPDWQVLMAFLPADMQGGLVARSAMAATFTAALEMAKAGKLAIRQEGTFGPIYIRAQDRKESPVGES